MLTNIDRSSLKSRMLAHVFVVLVAGVIIGAGADLDRSRRETENRPEADAEAPGGPPITFFARSVESEEKVAGVDVTETGLTFARRSCRMHRSINGNENGGDHDRSPHQPNSD